MKKGFNLTDILLTLIIVGTLIMLSISIINKNDWEKDIVPKLYEFNSTLESSVQLWKADIGCFYNVKTCLYLQKTIFGTSPDFNQISKFMNVVEKIESGPSETYWLPIKTFNYYGTEISDYDYRSNANRSRYLLLDGKIISVQTDDNGFWILVDVNGKKPPNRIGKDTFHVIVGYSPSNDINYYAREKTRDGLCGPNYGQDTIECDPNNTNPLMGNGASPGAYTIIHHKLPDYDSISKTVPGFQP